MVGRLDQSCLVTGRFAPPPDPAVGTGKRGRGVDHDDVMGGFGLVFNMVWSISRTGNEICAQLF